MKLRIIVVLCSLFAGAALSYSGARLVLRDRGGRDSGSRERCRLGDAASDGHSLPALPVVRRVYFLQKVV